MPGPLTTAWLGPFADADGAMSNRSALASETRVTVRTNLVFIAFSSRSGYRDATVSRRAAYWKSLFGVHLFVGWWDIRSKTCSMVPGRSDMSARVALGTLGWRPVRPPSGWARCASGRRRLNGHCDGDETDRGGDRESLLD